MEKGFEKGTTHNLPVVDAGMVFEFYRNHQEFHSAEVKNVKSSRATRESYGDNAVGYVQVRRHGTNCIVMAKLTPEHKVHGKGYRVSVEIDEKKEVILHCKCLDCAASEGGCKHSVAFLLWLHRRSEEPSVTSTDCYWKASKLSRVGSTEKFVTLEKVSSHPVPSLPDVPAEQIFKDFLKQGRQKGCLGTIFIQPFKTNAVSGASLHKLSLLYKSECKGVLSATGFMDFISSKISLRICEEVQTMTMKQYKSSSWYEIRYGRITASKLHEASRCKTFEGSLVEELLGGSKMVETPAMSRGKRLEGSVLKKIADMKNLRLRSCGIFIHPDFPIFGASPDGISDTHVVEIKCPIKERAISSYIEKNGKICPKPFAQIQLQMMMTGRKRGYFCVASPDFELSEKFHLLEVEYDEQFITEIMKSAEFFWKTVIFTHLIK